MCASVSGVFDTRRGILIGQLCTRRVGGKRLRWIDGGIFTITGTVNLDARMRRFSAGAKQEVVDVMHPSADSHACHK